MMERRYLPNGDRMVLVEFPDEISLQVNAQVHSLARALEKAELAGVVESIPAYRSLGVIYDPGRISFSELVDALAQMDPGREPTQRLPLRVVEIPVAYGGEMGPDLDFVAHYHSLSTEKIVRIHSSVEYQVYFLGFTPGFPYLGGMPPQIATPRMTEPRSRVPAGSVAIGGQQTGVYPIESPGGWRIIGRTPRRLFDRNRENPFLLSPGDGVRFRPM